MGIGPLIRKAPFPGVRRMREVSDGVHWSRHCGFAFCAVNGDDYCGRWRRLAWLDGLLGGRRKGAGVFGGVSCGITRE